MSIEFHCSRCSRLLRTGDDTAGRMAQCPECGAQTQVPAQDMSAAPSPMPPSGGGGSFDPTTPQPAGSSGYQTPYQAAPVHVPGQGPQGNQFYALQRVSAPATCLIITAVLGLGLHLLGILGAMLNVGLAGAGMHRNHVPDIVFTGPVALAQGGIGIILSIVVLIGAIKMKGLENYGFAMAASIIALIPCISPCCLLGIPFGIWALVVLSDPIVKSSFKT
jgi:hypothetical protein